MRLNVSLRVYVRRRLTPRISWPVSPKATVYAIVSAERARSREASDRGVHATLFSPGLLIQVKSIIAFLDPGARARALIEDCLLWFDI